MSHGNTVCDNISKKQFGGGECKCYECNVPCIIVHGGAGNFSESVVIEKMTGCKKAAINGYKKLMNGGTSVDAVEAALWWLECDEFFNCSYGSVLNETGNVQMDASIMDGFSFKCGSVAAVSDIEHPITLAKFVMNNFPNSIFVGDGAKNLAKHANLNWLSEGNMVAPVARIAFHSGEKGKLDANVDNQSLLDVDTFANNFGTVGCVAYDGYSIAAGTTTGGLNKKLVGRVGDTPILGCGTYATRNVGCSLTGHGESIMKLGLAREIVDDIERNLLCEEALHKHFSYMLQKFDKIGGGIVLQSDGRWATYFTSDKMPYAVIENDLITYGARLYEEKREMYNSEQKDSECVCECPLPIVFLIFIACINSMCTYTYVYDFMNSFFSIAIKRGLLKEKLFSFEEWQRYIECRKTILAHAHFPTKMKYNSESNGIDDLCLKFAEFITSKSNKNEAEMKSSKHTLPVETIVAMTRHITNLNINDPLAQTVDIFPASLTPLHSYLEHLLDHPFYDIPSVARNDFFRTKVEYMIKTDTLIELAKKCDLDLEVIDLNAHFLEKNVPPFEQSRMPSIEELKQLVDVQDDLKHDTGSESLNDYLHSKTLCTIKLDVAKEQYYSKVGTAKNSDDINLESDFSFTETLPDGRLAIPAFDSEDEEENSTEQVNQERILLDKEFCSKYNIQLSCTEKESIRKLHTAVNLLKKPKVRFVRNAKGQFVRKIETSDDFSFAKENVNLNNRQTNAEIKTRNIVQKQSLLEDININDIDIDNTELNIELFDENDCFNLSDISILNQNHDAFVPAADKINLFNEKHRFFKPFREYWMHHCVFSLVRPKNFSMFERSLPRSFRWLLNECALIVEMSTQDLYEEICLIESYHSQNPKNKDRSDANSIPKNQWNFILNKW